MKPIERFKELYEWSLARYNADFTRIRIGNRFFTYGEAVKGEPFGIRTLISSIWTLCLLIYEEQALSRIQIDRLATAEEDRELRQDAFVNGNVPIQYKIRNKSYPDFPCVRLQPFHGFNSSQTSDGRDYLGLQAHTTEYNYAAIWEHGGFTKIHRIKSSDFWNEVQKLDQDWARKPVPLFEAWSRGDGAQVRHQKSEQNYTKYNFYLPPHLFESLETVQISSRGQAALRKMYEISWNWVAEKYIK